MILTEKNVNKNKL